MVLLPKDHIEARFEYAIDQSHAHAVLLMEEPQAVPLITTCRTFSSDDILSGFYNHRIHLHSTR